VIRTVGPFDENYPPFYWEDIDYGLRTRKANYDLAVVSETCYHHKRATVGSSNSDDRIGRIEDDGRRRTLDKHAADCPTWVLAENGFQEDIPELETMLAGFRPNTILHVISPDMSVEERRPWRVVLPGEMYPRSSYTRACRWDGGWQVGPYRVPLKDAVLAGLNDPIERGPW